MKHIQPDEGYTEEVGCQAGEDHGFDHPMIDDGKRIEAARLHYV
jgi:hypothetical protein